MLWNAGSRKRRKSFQPKPAEAFQVDAADAVYSSSQLMADEPDAAGEMEVKLPLICEQSCTCCMFHVMIIS